MCPGDFDSVAFSDELEGCFIAVFDVPGGKSGVDPEETGRKERLVVPSLNYIFSYLILPISHIIIIL